MVQEHSVSPLGSAGIQSPESEDSQQTSQSLRETHTRRWKPQGYPASSQNERRQTRQHRQDKRRSGAETELPRRPEGETREQSHEDLG